MTAPLRHTLRLLALAVVFMVLGAPVCWAQLGVASPLSGGGVGPMPDLKGGEQQVPGQAPARALPPALPGTKSNPDTVAPATKLPSEMNPTDALFDAINRGDVAAARDALNRGADLDGHNVLGMTPIELSIDLSRNDISFLLLSEGAADAGGGNGGGAPLKGAKGKVTVGTIRDVHLKSAPASRVTPPPPPRVAKLFSGDGGTPVPQAGFLGFDSASRN